jgi:hypothetical protein
MATENHMPSWNLNSTAATIVTSAIQPTQRSTPPRKVKSSLSVNAMAVRPPKPSSVITAALWIAPGACWSAMYSSGRKISASAAT